MDKIESVTDFEEACAEVHVLLNSAKRNMNNLRKYATFNKAAIVLLCAKFEAFLEDFLEEYATHHLKASSNHSVDRSLYNHILDCVLSQIDLVKSNAGKRKLSIAKLEAFCGGTEIRPIKDFPFDPRLKMGKHGEGEIKRLLITYGFVDYSEERDVKIFFEKFNSLMMIRNNIIHQDATPSITHQSVKEYLDIVTGFIKGLESVAIEKMMLAV